MGGDWKVGFEQQVGGPSLQNQRHVNHDDRPEWWNRSQNHTQSKTETWWD